MDTTHHLRLVLARLAQGDAAAREELFRRMEPRLRRLVNCLLHRDFVKLARFEQTDDLLQDVHVRLLKSWDGVLQDDQGQAVRDPAVFLGRVSRLIHEVLLDSVRHHFGRSNNRPQVQSLSSGDSQTDAPGFDPSSDTHNPEILAQFSEFHDAVKALPEPLRQVVDLHWYQDLPHPEVAAMLGLGESTVRRYWVKARLQLIDKLGQNPFSD